MSSLPRPRRALRTHSSVTDKEGLGFVIYTVDGAEGSSAVLLPELEAPRRRLCVRVRIRVEAAAAFRAEPTWPPPTQSSPYPWSSFVNVRGDRLYHEHIWWDQAGVLLQAGILPTHVDRGDGAGLRLPVARPVAARLLADERDGTSGEMITGANAE